MRVVDLQLTLRAAGTGYAAEARLSHPGSQADAVLAADAPVALDPVALLALAFDPAAYGRALTAQFFGDQRLCDAWQRARALADGSDAALRLRLRFPADAPDLHALRWETLRDPLTDVPLATDARLRLVRSLDSPDTRPITLGPKPALRALLVVANPRDLSAYGLAGIDVDGEVGRVQKALGRIPLTVVGDHEAAVSRRATLRAVQSALCEGPAILCLICHGAHNGDDTTLWLEDDERNTAHVAGSTFSEMLAQLARPPLLVTLIACEGGGVSHHAGALAALGPRMALAGVGAVVAMQAKLSLGAARALLPALFADLDTDGAIDRAVAVGRAALRDEGEWWVPALWLRVRDGRLWREGQGRALDEALARFDALPLEYIPDVASLPPGSRMPFARNPLFVGRAADLRWLAVTLKAGATAAIGQVAAATGLGGIGKTNLATEWAYRYGSFFAGGVFWLSVADPVGVPGEIAACGGPEALGLYGEADGLSQDEQVALVLRAWQEPIPRLIVLDNCEDEALLAVWRPRIGGGCRVLVTSRSSEWDGALGVVARRLGVLERHESIALLHSLRQNLTDQEADAIARVLGDLPLALHLAGSFLRSYPQEQPARYLARLETVLLGHPSLAGRGTRHSVTAHDLHIARTFALSYDRLNAEEQTDADARRLLSCAACLAPGETFPTDLLLATLGRDQEDETARLDAQDALARLVSLGLLDREQSDALVLHRLLHAFVSDVADDPEAQGAVEQALNSAAVHLNNTGYPAAMQPIATHLRYGTDRAAGRDDERAARLCGNLAYYLNTTGDYGAARPLYERALAVTEQALGPSHPQTATSLNNLAELFRAVGDYGAARPLYERALAIYEQALGPNHPQTAQSLNNLAINHYYQNEFETAADLMRRALDIREQQFGPDHPDTQGSRRSLAAIEQRLAGTAAPPSAEAQIAQITQQAEAAVAQALAEGTAEQRVALAQQLEDVARQVEQGDASWRALAGHLRTLKARLEHAEPPEHAELRQRAESAVARALAEGTPDERAALAEKLRVTADTYAGGQPTGSPGQALATDLRALAARLGA